MDYRAIDEVQGWAKEKFEPDTKLGSLARMPVDVVTAEEVEMLHAAREGWLVGLNESGSVIDTESYSCTD